MARSKQFWNVLGLDPAKNGDSPIWRPARNGQMLNLEETGRNDDIEMVMSVAALGSGTWIWAHNH